MNKILAVVVTYNRAELLKECLSALFNQTMKTDILVVDNASSDGTAEYLSGVVAENFSYLRLASNTGGAGGFNAGLKEGMKRGYKKFWLMDDDTIPTPDALEKLIEADKNLNGEYGFLSSLALFTDGTPCAMNNHLLPSKITTDSIVYREESYFKVLTATFVSLLIKAETVERFGYPVKEMFIWSDDTEFTSRITKELVGYFIPQSVVTHKMKTNDPPRLENMPIERLDRMVMNIRNRYFIARRDGFKKKIRFYARHCKLFFKVLFKAKDHRFKRLNVIFKGIWKGWGFRPKIERYSLEK